MILLILLTACSPVEDHLIVRHFEDRDDYILYVAWPLEDPAEWKKADYIDKDHVELEGEKIMIKDVDDYLILYPSGNILEITLKDLRLPGEAKIMEREERSYETLRVEDLKAGNKFVEITFGKSTRSPESPDHYSTTLKNIADERIKIYKFAGFSRIDGEWLINTINNNFFSEDDFKDWYGLEDGWLEPNESATDHNNYGSPPVLWAYYFETESGEKHIAGEVLS